MDAFIHERMGKLSLLLEPNLEILRLKMTVSQCLLIVTTPKKRLNVFGYLLYALEKVINHIISHMDAFIYEIMGKLLLLLERKIGKIVVKTDSIAAFIAIES